MRLALAAVALMVAVGPAFAAERCQVRVLKNVGAEDDPSSVLPRGSREFGPVTQVRVDKKSGRMSYCSYCAHGSFCYNATAFDFVTPCRFTPETFDDPAAFNYGAD